MIDSCTFLFTGFLVLSTAGDDEGDVGDDGDEGDESDMGDVGDG